MLPSVRAFEVFGVLLGRCVPAQGCIEGEATQAENPSIAPAFVFVEDVLGVRSFVSVRAQAARDALSCSWSDAWTCFQRATELPDADILVLQQSELDAEAFVCALVQKVAVCVQPGDILVNTFMPHLGPEILSHMLVTAGFCSPVAGIYTLSPRAESCSETAICTWESLRTVYNIVEHVTATNAPRLSLPVDVPIRYEPHIALLPTEEALLLRTSDEVGISGAAWLLTACVFDMRLAGRLPCTSTVAQFAMHGGGLLMLGCYALEIATICKRESLNRVLCDTRDCSALQLVLSALCPDLAVEEFYSSRRANECASAQISTTAYHEHTAAMDLYDRYIREQYIHGKTLIVRGRTGFRSGRGIIKRVLDVEPRVHALTGQIPSFPGMTISDAAAWVSHTWIESLCTCDYGYITGVDATLQPDANPLTSAVEPIVELREIVRGFCTGICARQAKVPYLCLHSAPDGTWSALCAAIQKHLVTVPLQARAPKCKLRIREALCLAGSAAALSEFFHDRVRATIPSLQARVSICLVNVVDTRAMLAWATLFGERAFITGVSRALDPYDAAALLPTTCAVATCSVIEAARARGPFDIVIDMAQTLDDKVISAAERKILLSEHMTAHGWLATAIIGYVCLCACDVKGYDSILEGKNLGFLHVI